MVKNLPLALQISKVLLIELSSLLVMEVSYYFPIILRIFGIKMEIGTEAFFLHLTTVKNIHETGRTALKYMYSKKAIN